MKKLIAITLLGISLAAPGWAREGSAMQEALRRTVAMVQEPAMRALAAKHSLDIVNVTWEDTGRYKGSSVGPNISDMTLQVQAREPDTDKLSLHCLPVIRFPNFSDKTADIKLDDFYLKVGNESGKDLRRVSLRDYLDAPRDFMSNPDSWKGDNKTLLAERDEHVLVSAQACFLPIPKGEKVEFNPVLFNYQSYPGNPAVLTILATREGTSMTIIDNQRDAFEFGQTWGQRLFFNQNGERASLTGERLSDHKASQGPSSPDQASPAAAGEEGLNMVMMIQVPLKYEERALRAGTVMMAMPACPVDAESSVDDRVENAVIGHGKVEGPFTEVADLAIERDPRFPVRVTVQFYKATADGKATDEDLKSIAQQIDRVYAEGDYVGSLVTGGETGRPTEYEGEKTEPAGWWQDFAERYQAHWGEDWTGLTSLWEYLDLQAR